MPLRAEVRQIQGRPMLVLNGEPTGEFWCYGDPNAWGDFRAAGIRICQFQVPFPSWWLGPRRYDFAALDAKVHQFLAQATDALLMPRVHFGLAGEGWWAEQHPAEISRGRTLAGTSTALQAVSSVPVECPFSAGSERWARDAAEALRDFVSHCEASWPDNIIGYQLGAGISAEWFRWWAFIEDAYEDASPAALQAFRAYLRMHYVDDAALQRAWGQPSAVLADARPPSPLELHDPQGGFFRNPIAERPVIDWLDCLNAAHAAQLMTLAAAAKGASGRRKLVGAFFGYFWPHWNTQNPARSGHLHLRRLLGCADLDFISSPYHYDNRGREGFHHAQTVSQSIERAGKLHVDEIDTATHLVNTAQRHRPWFPQAAKTPADSLALLRRDAASVLGTAGTGWWMDLRLERWYADAQIQATVATFQQLARQAAGDPAPSHAEVALVVDDESYLYCSLHSPLNQFFTSLPRQCLWSDLGFPFDTLLLDEVPQVRPYRVYVFLNAWHVEARRRDALRRCVRRPGVTSIWFYGAGCLGGPTGAAGVTDLVGMNVRAEQSVRRPEVALAPRWRGLIGGGGRGPAAPQRYGAGVARELTQRLLGPAERVWEVEVSPWFVAEDPQAVVLGHYVEGGAAGLALLDREGWRSVYSAAPLLPGEVLRALAAEAGVHLYARLGCSVRHRGPLLSVTATRAGLCRVQAPAGRQLTEYAPAADGRWAEVGAPKPVQSFDAEVGQTMFFRCV